MLEASTLLARELQKPEDHAMLVIGLSSEPETFLIGRITVGYYSNLKHALVLWRRAASSILLLLVASTRIVQLCPVLDHYSTTKYHSTSSKRSGM